MSAKLPPHAPLLISKIKRIQKIHPHWDFKEIVNYIHDKTSHGDPTWPLIDSLYLKLRQMSRGHSMRTNPSPAKRKAISKKIQKLIHEGMSQKQAVAVALNMLRSKKNPEIVKNYNADLREEIETLIANGEIEKLHKYMTYLIKTTKPGLSSVAYKTMDYKKYLLYLNRFITLTELTQEEYLKKIDRECEQDFDGDREDINKCKFINKSQFDYHFQRCLSFYFDESDFRDALHIIYNSKSFNPEKLDILRKHKKQKSKK